MKLTMNESEYEGLAPREGEDRGDACGSPDRPGAMDVEAELRRQERRHRELMREYQALFDGIADPLMALDREMRVLWANAAAGRFYEVFSGQPCYEQLHQRDEPCVNCPVVKSLASGSREEGLITDRSGRIWGGKAFPVKDENGQVVKVIHLASDITEKLRLREQSLRESRLASMGELAAGIAHEINNPNALILMNAPLIGEALTAALEILDRQYDAQGDFPLGRMEYSRMREVLPLFQEDICEAARKISRIVEDLKEFVRDDGGAGGEPYRLNDACRAAARLVQSKVKKSTDRFTMALAEDLPELRGNFQRIEQVIVNLLVNACDALSRRSQGIHLRTAYDAAEKRVILELRDEGRGIPPENLSRILEPFFTTKRQSGGTGLGLSVSMSILKEMRGTLEFDSEVGAGTTARVSLPYEGE